MKLKLTTSQSLLILLVTAIFFTSVFAVLVLKPPTLSFLKTITFDTSLSLLDHDGTEINSDHFKNQKMMIFFGFTYCPEICPTTLSDISIWLDEVGTNTDKIQINFVTVDPERDTAEELNKYMKNFSSQIIGITGTQIELEKLFTAFGVYAQKVPFDENSYTVDHSSSIYLVDRNGKLFDVISYGESLENAVKKLRGFLNY